MHEYLITELTYLSNLCLKIEETGEAFQNCLKVSEKLRNLPIVSVFSYVTPTTFFFTILTNYTLRFHADFELYTTMNTENGIYSGNTSKEEFVFQNYTKFNQPTHELMGSYLTARPFMLGKEIPDIYDKTLKQFIYFQAQYFVFDL